MGSVKTGIKKDKVNKQGQVPIVIRLNHKGKSKEIYFKKYINPDHWNDKNPQNRIRVGAGNHLALNARLQQEVRKYEEAMLQLEIEGLDYSVSDIFNIVNQKVSQRASEQLLGAYIKQFCKDNPDQLSSTTLKNYNKLANCINSFRSNTKISEVNQKWVIDYRKKLAEDGKAVNTIHERLKNLKRITRMLQRQEVLNTDPFKDIKLKQEEGKREFLTIEEFQSFREYEPKTESERKVKDAFVFSCYTGLRFSDMATLKQEDIQSIDEASFRIYKKIDKTQDWLSIKLNPTVIEIGKRLDEKNPPYVLDIIDNRKKLDTHAKIKQHISARNAYYNKTLKNIIQSLKINKNISMHCARHTFATISLQLGVPIEVVSKLLGHKSLTQTLVYAKILDKQKDEAIDLWGTI